MRAVLKLYVRPNTEERAAKIAQAFRDAEPLLEEFDGKLGLWSYDGKLKYTCAIFDPSSGEPGNPFGPEARVVYIPHPSDQTKNHAGQMIAFVVRATPDEVLWESFLGPDIRRVVAARRSVLLKAAVKPPA